MNAKEELLGKMQQIEEWLEGTKIVCATISLDVYNWDSDDETESKPYVLKQGHTHVELKEFLNSIDFDYNNGYGSQELYGTVWFTNGIWLSRHEYDGSEYWSIHKYPAIPHELQPDLITTKI